MNDPLHSAIIEHACRHHGWQSGPGWKKVFLTRCRERPSWRGEIAGGADAELFGAFRRNPDAWRIVAEDQDTPDMDWSYPVLVLEFLEVEIANPMPLDKRRDYVDLWWRFDGSDYFHFRVYRAERYQPPILWLDFDSVHYEMGL